MGKQEPPYPIPAWRNLGPIRLSRPIPYATSSTSAPSSSETLAISLMNEILVARKAFEASLIISALATSVLTTGASSGAYRASTRSAYSCDSSSAPTTTRSGLMKSPTALPSFRNSGLETYPVPGRRRWIERPVPTGTVLFMTRACSLESPSSSSTLSTRERSASPE